MDLDLEALARAAEECEQANSTFPEQSNNIPVIQKTPKGTTSKKIAPRDAKKGPSQAGPKKKYYCAVVNCPYSSPYAKDLTRHNRKHTGERPFACDRCPKAFSRYDKLRMHIRIHNGDRSYKCNQCNYAAVDSGSLKKHIRTHTDERPYQCQVCPYRAKDSSQLVVHLRHHTGDTPYVCMNDGCDAAFKTPSDLQRHTRLHTGEKPYACELCNYRAAVKCNLKTHLKNFHKVNGNGTNVTEAENKTDPMNTSPTATETNKVLDNGHVESVSVITKVNKDAATSQWLPKTGKNELPFLLACKLCNFTGATMKSFTLHMRKKHSEGVGTEFRPAGISPKKRKAIKIHSSRFFECDLCAASFVKENSLRCHMRQHSEPTLHPPTPVFSSHQVPTIQEAVSVKGTANCPTVPVSIASSPPTLFPTTADHFEIVEHDETVLI